MSLTRTQARDEMFALVKAKTDTIRSQLPEEYIIWEDTDSGGKPAEDTVPLPAWARVQLRHATGAQTGISANSGERLFDRSGLITIQLFTPRGGLSQADEITELLESAFTGISTPGGVWFRNVRTVEIGEDGPWFQNNVLADFVYHQRK